MSNGNENEIKDKKKNNLGIDLAIFVHMWTLCGHFVFIEYPYLSSIIVKARSYKRYIYKNKNMWLNVIGLIWTQNINTIL